MRTLRQFGFLLSMIMFVLIGVLIVIATFSGWAKTDDANTLAWIFLWILMGVCALFFLLVGD